MWQDVTLTSGKTIKVRKLGIFELDDLESDIPGPFTYKMVMFNGEEHDVLFDYTRYAEPPAEPVDKDPPKNSPGYSKLVQWQLYTAAKSHAEKRYEARLAYYKRVIQYILETCLSPQDVNDLLNDEDWRRVHEAALVPRVTKEILAHVFRSTYKATFNDMEIFDALQQVSGGLGMYDAISLWENKLMLQLRLTEHEYVMLPVIERARKIGAMLLDDMMAQLEADRMRKERD